MIIEFLNRWSKLRSVSHQLSEEERAEQEVRRIISGEIEKEDMGPSVELEFEYGKVTLRVEDIKSLNEYDKEHTVLRTYDGDLYTAKCPYSKMKKIYEDSVGKVTSIYELGNTIIIATNGKSKGPEETTDLNELLKDIGAKENNEL